MSWKDIGIWIFIIVFFVTAPINAIFSWWVISSLFSSFMFCTKIVLAIILFLMALALEEIVVLVAGRSIIKIFFRC